MIAPVSASSQMPMFRLDKVSFSAVGRMILHPTNVQFEAGRVHALVGANGSGKSTLVKMLARQQQGSGSITLFGQEITTLADRAFARDVAYMPQFTPPAEGMTVRELVGLGRFPWHGALGRFSDEDAAKVEAALEQTDLIAMAERMVDSLSGGERQRAWLAMMVAQDTKCLLLDEPTSALDIAHQVEMLALIRKLSRERSVGVVIVIHDINMAVRFCDSVVALRGGEMVAQGDASTMLDTDVLQRIYGLPMGIVQTPGAAISYVL